LIGWILCRFRANFVHKCIPSLLGQWTVHHSPTSMIDREAIFRGIRGQSKRRLGLKTAVLFRLQGRIYFLYAIRAVSGLISSNNWSRAQTKLLMGSVFRGPVASRTGSLLCYAACPPRVGASDVLFFVVFTNMVGILFHGQVSSRDRIFLCSVS